MGPWKSPFEMVIPGCSPARVAELARDRGSRRTQVGLIVRVRDGRLRARYNELSRQSTAPLLKARLVQEGAGTRIVGEIHWTNVLAAPFGTAVVGLVGFAAGAWLITGGDAVVGVCFVLGGVAFGALSVTGFRSESSERSHEEGRLRDELLATFTKHGRR